VTTKSLISGLAMLALVCSAQRGVTAADNSQKKKPPAPATYTITQLDAGANRELRGDVEGVGDHAEPGVTGQCPGHLGGRRTSVEPDGRGLGSDQGDGRRRDRPLGVVVLTAAVAHGQLVENAARRGAAVGARQEVLLLEAGQVTAYRGLRDAQLLGELGDADGAALVEPLQNPPESDVLTHGCTVTRTRVLVSRIAFAHA